MRTTTTAFIHSFETISRRLLLILTLTPALLHAQESATADTSSSDFPFSFTFILGKTQSAPAEIGSKVNGSSSYRLFEGPTAYLAPNTFILISKRLRRPTTLTYFDESKTYYEAYLYGIRFYIDSAKVSLYDDVIHAQLDTLDQCTEAVQERFSLFTQNLSLGSFQESDYPRFTKIFSQYKTHGIAIPDWSWGSEEYVEESKSVSFTFYNPTKKTIKYIYVTVTGYNPVNDRVGTKTLTCVGPILPDESGSYSFKHVFYSSTMSAAKITGLRVQYMDKSVKIVAQPWRCVFSDEDSQFIEEVTKNLTALEVVRSE